MTFNEYIATAKILDTMAGDFINCARGDQHFPAIASRKQLLQYARGAGYHHRNIDGVVDAAKFAWANYRRLERRA